MQSKIVWAGTAASACLYRSVDLDIVGLVRRPKPRSPKPRPIRRKSREIGRRKIESGRRNPTRSKRRQPSPSLPPIAPVEDAAHAAAKPPENKPVEPKVAEVKPAEPNQPSRNQSNPSRSKPSRSTRNPSSPSRSTSIRPSRWIRRSRKSPMRRPVLPSLPAIPAGDEIQPMPINENVPLPVTAAKLVKQVPPAEIDVETRLDDIIPNLELKDDALRPGVVDRLRAEHRADHARCRRDALAGRLAARSDLGQRERRHRRKTARGDRRAAGNGASKSRKGKSSSPCPPSKRKRCASVHYTVADLCENGTTAADLAELAAKVRFARLWEIHGGQGTIKIENDALTISQTGAVHRGTRGLLRKTPPRPGTCRCEASSMPNACNWPPPTSRRNPRSKNSLREFPRTDDRSRKFSITSARSRTWIFSSTARRWPPPACRTKWKSLSRWRRSRSKPRSFELLRPLKLGYRAIDAHTLQVATLKELDRRSDWEIYPVGKLLAAGVSGQDLIDRVRKSVAPASWPGRGQIYYDPPSKSLVVSQSPAVQAAIFRYLSEKPAKK